MTNTIHTELRGMTWSHPRGIDPLLACAPLIERKGIRIRWDARSLQGFEEASIAAMAKTYDLMAIDHPFMGDAFEQGALRPVDELIAPAFLKELQDNSVGLSTESYVWAGKLWAAPIDAASQVAAYRADLLPVGATAPSRWHDVLQLAKERGVGLAANPTHILLAFATICEAFATDRSVTADLRPAWWGDQGVEASTGLAALQCLRDLMNVVHPSSWDYDPIMLYDHMVANDDIAYSPIAFGYSNYARPSAYDRPLSFTGVPSVDGGVIGGMLGGVGLAVSRHCKKADAIAAVLEIVASGEVQSGIYVQAGGQPAHRAAWTSDNVQNICPNFFRPTLESLDKSFVRARLPSYPRFQREGGELLHSLLKADRPVSHVLEAFNDLWRKICPTAVLQAH